MNEIQLTQRQVEYITAVAGLSRKNGSMMSERGRRYVALLFDDGCVTVVTGGSMSRNSSNDFYLSAKFAVSDASGATNDIVVEADALRDSLLASSDLQTGMSVGATTLVLTLKARDSRGMERLISNLRGIDAASAFMDVRESIPSLPLVSAVQADVLARSIAVSAALASQNVKNLDIEVDTGHSTVVMCGSAAAAALLDVGTGNETNRHIAIPRDVADIMPPFAGTVDISSDGRKVVMSDGTYTLVVPMGDGNLYANVLALVDGESAIATDVHVGDLVSAIGQAATYTIAQEFDDDTIFGKLGYIGLRIADGTLDVYYGNADEPLFVASIDGSVGESLAIGTFNPTILRSAILASSGGDKNGRVSLMSSGGRGRMVISGGGGKVAIMQSV